MAVYPSTARPSRNVISHIDQTEIRYIFRGVQHVALRRPERMKTRPGYASLPACSLGERRIYRNQTWVGAASGLGGLIPIIRSLAETARWKRCVPMDFPKENKCHSS